MTQIERILAYCIAHGSITVREATVELEINSPRKCITRIRRKGYKVVTVPEKRTRLDGRVVRYNRYFISD